MKGGLSYIIIITTYLICGVSMLLTALFALSFSSYGLLQFSNDRYLEHYMIPVLMVMVGICIDLCKYLFWQYKAKSHLFKLLSILLVFFSWAASVTFFISQEQLKLQANRKNTAVYKAYESEVSALKLEIIAAKTLINKRINSRYHSQWKKGEDMLELIRLSEGKLQSLIAIEDTIGLQDAWQSSGSLVLFDHISHLSGFSAKAISNISYSLLALLIEICALGLIDLSKFTRIDTKSTLLKKKKQDVLVKPAAAKRSRLTREEMSKKRMLIRNAIMNKEFPPRMEVIKIKYHLSYHAIRVIFSELVKEGHLMRKGRLYQFSDKK